MICILHGYLLEGSGSNLWTRSIIQSLCRSGETVHLLCQENHPQLYDFIAEVYIYHEDGSIETLLQRETPYTGRCIMHKPKLEKTLPVYVWDRYEEFPDVQPMAQLSDTAVESYLEKNIRALKQVIANHNIKVLHANHAVLMSVVAQRVSNDLSIPYAIMPHGSAIEYAVKIDKRFFNYALKAFKQAQRIYVIGNEIRRRVKTIFPSIDNLDAKMVELNLGVDTGLFLPVCKSERKGNINVLCEKLANTARGKNQTMINNLRDGLTPDINKSDLMNLIKENSDYNAKHTDYNVEERLKSIDWNNDKILLFVGRLIASKGIHSIIAALPFIFKDYPDAKLIVVGHGPLREPLEALLWALENGARNLVENIVEWGTKLEGSGNKPLPEIEHYFKRLSNQSQLDTYFETAEKYINKDRIIFTGYLTHKELRYLFPVCNTAVFPSVVAEAGPLVFLEAMASGCFPIGTYFAGMAASIDSLAGSIPDRILNLMKLSPDPKETIGDMVSKIKNALTVDNEFKSALRRVAVEKYDWQNVAKRFGEDLKKLAI
jgi:glycosyltransferase involved in cell wall biosynthesis